MADFTTSQQAADVAAITPTDIGVSANDFVRKIDLVNTNKFDVTKLTSYNNVDFVERPDVVVGIVTLSLFTDESLYSRGNVQIDDNPPFLSVKEAITAGTSVRIHCIMKEGDVFDGWYEGGTKVFSSQTHTFIIQRDMDLVAKFFYLDVTPTSLSFAGKDNAKTFSVQTNVSWTIE